MTTVNAFGFFRTRLDERLSNLKAALLEIFPEGANLDDDTMDGQTVGIFAEAQSDIDQLAEDVYNAFNPQTATGVQLSRVVQYNGITRIEGAFSIGVVLAIGQSGTIIPEGALIGSDTLSVDFVTTEEAIIPDSGEVFINVRSSTKGVFPAPSGTLNKIDTPVYGWQSVTNPLDVVPGRTEETDAALRARRRVSTSTPAQGITDSVLGALLNLEGVLQARVYENFEDVPDANGQPAHSIYCIVEGGSLQEIADTIWLKKSSGCTMIGAISQPILDSMGNPHIVKFSRPVDKNVYVKINLQTRPGWPTDGVARIKSAILAWALENQKIGAEVINSRLYDPVNTVPGQSINDLFTGIAANPSTEVNIPVTFEELARFDSTRIEVNILP